MLTRFAVIKVTYQELVDDKLASALVDWIVHHGRLVEFKGESRSVANSLMLGNRKEG